MELNDNKKVDMSSGATASPREREGPECKKARLMNESQTLDEHAKAMKVAGFSLSAIEEMRNRAEEDSNSQTLDQQLRHFQVLDEVNSNSDDEDGKCNKMPKIHDLLNKHVDRPNAEFVILFYAGMNKSNKTKVRFSMVRGHVAYH